jgi:DNA repair protein RecN (Recombination protein N)
MLRALTVKDVATIESCSLYFGAGLTVLTGETGAGKSLLVDAIGLALGGRADSGLVRSGARKAVVSLSALVSGAALAVCEQNGVEVEDGEIVVVREVSSEGRSTVRINGRLASVGVLRAIGAELVDMHGQHDHQALLDVDRQIVFLDSWIGAPCLSMREGVEALFFGAEGVRRRLATLRADRRDIEQRVDMLRFQTEEISGVGPVAGEFEELEARIFRLRHAEKLVTASSEALEALSEGEGAALEKLGASLRSLEAGATLDPGLEQVIDPLRESVFSLEEAVRALHAYHETLDLDPSALEESASRLDSLKRMRKKYGEDETAVIAYLEKARQELSLLEESGTNEEELVALLTASEKRLGAKCAELTKVRTKAAKEFATTVTKHVRELAMEKAEFEVRISPKPVQADGADSVEFYFTANPGDPPRPMAKVASGGEISRIMLATKVASAGRAGVPTLIFDEVDTGLSGRAAAVTATKLGELSRHYQVLVISHLPQIAGRATTHFQIEKREKGGRSSTEVLELEGEDRVAEVARMLAGEQVGESALANARELIGS